MNEKSKNLIITTAVYAIGNVGSKIVLFFLVPFYTLYLSQEEYGTTELLFTLAQLITPVITIVIHNAVIRYGLSKYSDPKSVLLNAYIVIIAGSFLAICISPLFGLYDAIHDWRWPLTIYIILSGFYTVNMNYLKVNEQNGWFASIGALNTLLMAVTNIILLSRYHMGVTGYMYAYLISTFFCSCLSFFAGHIPQALFNASFKKELMQEMVVYSFPLVFNDISWWVVHSADRIMIERMISVSAMGLYGIAAKIPSIINTMINVFSHAWSISAIKEFENDNDIQFYSSVLERYIFVCFGASIFLIGISKQFMKYYVSAAFFDSWRYVPLLLAAASFASIAYFYGSFYGALKRSKMNMVSTLIAAVTNILVNFYGAALGTLAAYMVMSFVRIFDIRQFIAIKINWIRFIVVIAVILIQAFLVTLDLYGEIVSTLSIIFMIALYKNEAIVTLRSISGIVKRFFKSEYM